MLYFYNIHVILVVLQGNPGGFPFRVPSPNFLLVHLLPLSVCECLLIDPEQASLEVVKVCDVFAHAFQVFARLDDDASPQGPSRSRSIHPRTYSRDDVHRGFTGELLSLLCHLRRSCSRRERENEKENERKKRKHEIRVLYRR